MKIVLKLIMIMMMTGVFTNLSYSQGGESAVAFLLLAPDSRAAGLGESGTGLADNSSAIFWNPAGVAFLTGTEIGITHSNWLPQFNLDLFYDYLTYRQYFEEIDGSVLASFTYMNYGEFNRTDENGPDVLDVFRSYDFAITAGFATKLSSDWGLGFNARLIHSQLADKPTGEEKGEGIATSVSFDIGAMWRPETLVLPFTDEDIGGKLSIGLNLSNMGPKITYIDQAQADPIPTNFRLGFAYQVFNDEFNSLIYTLDFSKLLISRQSTKIQITPDSTETRTVSDEWYQALFTSWGDEPFSNELRDIVTSMGLEYWYGQPGDFLFALRAGYFYEDPREGNRKFVTFGAGLRYDLYGFDFSYITTSVFKDGENHPLNNTLRFTVSIGWDAVPESTRGLPRGI